MNRLLLGCILLAVSWTASAADTTTATAPTLYKVEVIVFENLDPNAPQAEDWPADPGTPSLNNAMELDTLPAAAPGADETQSASDASTPNDIPAPGDTPPSAMSETPTPEMASISEAGADTTAPSPEPETPSWRWMAKSELSLDGDEQKLLNSGRYRPVLHIGWVQPLNTTDQGTPVHIYDGLKPKEDIPALESIDDEQVVVNPLASPPGAAPAPDAPNPVEIPPPQAIDEANPPPEEMPLQEPPPHILDGTFTLRQGRYLHVDVDLGYRMSYTPQATPPTDAMPGDTAAQPVTRYIRMTQSRRIRSDELNYLDHPLIGVLFVVSPYPETPADTTPK